MDFFPYFFTASISNTFSSALKIFKSLCAGSILSPSAGKLFWGESFSSLCMKSPLILFAVSPGEAQLSPHTPELPFCCSHSQVMLGWALWALLNAQLPLILAQGAIAREKANQGK